MSSNSNQSKYEVYIRNLEKEQCKVGLYEIIIKPHEFKISKEDNCENFVYFVVCPQCKNIFLDDETFRNCLEKFGLIENNNQGVNNQRGYNVNSLRESPLLQIGIGSQRYNQFKSTLCDGNYNHGEAGRLRELVLIKSTLDWDKNNKNDNNNRNNKITIYFFKLCVPNLTVKKIEASLLNSYNTVLNKSRGKAEGINDMEKKYKEIAKKLVGCIIETYRDYIENSQIQNQGEDYVELLIEKCKEKGVEINPM